MAMDALPPYRIMTRPQAAALFCAIAALGAAVVWVSNIWIGNYLEHIDSLRRTSPQAALAAMIVHLKILALIQIPPLAAFTAFMIWYARRAIDSQSLPPVGAWIVAGQRIRTGDDAVRYARILLALTSVIAVAGTIAIIYVYVVAVSLGAPPAA